MAEVKSNQYTPIEGLSGTSQTSEPSTPSKTPTLTPWRDQSGEGHTITRQSGTATLPGEPPTGKEAASAILKANGGESEAKEVPSLQEYQASVKTEEASKTDAGSHLTQVARANLVSSEVLHIVTVEHHDANPARSPSLPVHLDSELQDTDNDEPFQSSIKFPDQSVETIPEAVSSGFSFEGLFEDTDGAIYIDPADSQGIEAITHKIEDTKVTFVNAGDKAAIHVDKIAQDSNGVKFSYVYEGNTKETHYSPNTGVFIVKGKVDPQELAILNAFAYEHHAKHNLPPQKALVVIGISDTAWAQFQNDLAIALSNLTRKSEGKESEKPDSKKKVEHTHLEMSQPMLRSHVKRNKQPDSENEKEVRKTDSHKTEDAKTILEGEKKAYEEKRKKQEMKEDVQKHEAHKEIDQKKWEDHKSGI